MALLEFGLHAPKTFAHLCFQVYGLLLPLFFPLVRSYLLPLCLFFLLLFLFFLRQPIDPKAFFDSKNKNCFS